MGGYAPHAPALLARGAHILHLLTDGSLIEAAPRAMRLL